MKVLVKSAWGSDDPTNGTFPSVHGNALAVLATDLEGKNATFATPSNGRINC